MSPLEERPPNLPSGAEIIGAVVDLLGVRDERLSTRTARRYFKGDLVKEVSIHSVHTAVADALIRAGLGPASEDPAANEFLPTVITKAVALNVGWWDQLRVMLHRRVGPLELRNLPTLYTAFLRLAVIDLALRIGAHRHLTGQSDEVIRLREFVEENASGRYLNELRRNCDSPRLSLDRFSEAVEVDRHTVDRWLYKGERPTEENLQQVAKVLARSMSRGDAGQVVDRLEDVEGRRRDAEQPGKRVHGRLRVSKDKTDVRHPPAGERICECGRI
jgi:transcriptional regulator with XRE-family HTH domain